MGILERLKELQAKATPGPWSITEDLFNERPEVRDSGGRRIAVVTTDFPLSAKTVTANAELITTLHNNLPALLEVVEVLQALNRRGGLGLDVHEIIKSALAKLDKEVG